MRSAEGCAAGFERVLSLSPASATHSAPSPSNRYRAQGPDFGTDVEPSPPPASRSSTGAYSWSPFVECDLLAHKDRPLSAGILRACPHNFRNEVAGFGG